MENLHQPVLESEHLLLRPLRPTDFEEFYEVASDPLIWEQHPSPDRYKLEIFKAYFEDSIKSKGCLVVIEKVLGKIIGGSRYYDAVPEKKEIEIGYSFLARKFWGGKYNREMKNLMLVHAFKHYEVVRFHVDKHNLRSQKAMEKIGGKFTNTFEKPRPDGSIRTIFVYRIHKAIS